MYSLIYYAVQYNQVPSPILGVIDNVSLPIIWHTTDFKSPEWVTEISITKQHKIFIITVKQV